MAMSWVINLHRGVMALLWLAPLVGAAENRSCWPLLLLPLMCGGLLRLQRVAHRCRQRALALRAGAAVLAVLLLVLIDLGLRPVGGLLGPGGWYLLLDLAAVLLTLLRSSFLRGQGSSGHDSR